MFQSLNIQTRLGGFYLFYYSIVGTFMPYWNLYLQDQGFNYQEIGILSSIAIITRFFAPLIWGWIADKSGKRMLLVRIATWMEACIWFAIFVIPNSFQSVALLMLIFSFFQNAILAQFEGVTLFWLGCRCFCDWCVVGNYSNFYVADFAFSCFISCIFMVF